MTTDDRPTLPEQYTRAMNSSRLVLAERTRGDVDLLIAAGWVRDDLATKLYRLACEFDAARGEQTQARRRIAVATAEADELEKKAAKQKKAGQTLDALETSELAEDMRKEIANQLVSERAFLMMRLKSLESTKEALGAWAMERAIATRFKSPGPLPTEAGPTLPARMRAWRGVVRDRAACVARISGRVLEVYLDNLCAPCQGRGFNGGFGGPQKICRACSGSGHRKPARDDSGPEMNFAHFLLAEIEGMQDGVERAMRRFLAQQQPA